jgi:CRISPR-associated protein Cas2
MELLVVYDIATSTPSGSNRLRRVAHVCSAYGQRVQYSVFECTVSRAQRAVLESELLKAIDTRDDSLRIYTLQEPFQRHVKQYGKAPQYDRHAPLVF